MQQKIHWLIALGFILQIVACAPIPELAKGRLAYQAGNLEEAFDLYQQASSKGTLNRETEKDQLLNCFKALVGINTAFGSKSSEFAGFNYRSLGVNLRD